MTVNKNTKSAPQGDVTKTATSLILPPSDWEEYSMAYEDCHSGLRFNPKIEQKGCWLFYEGKKVHLYFENYIEMPLVQHLKFEYTEEGYAEGEERLIPLVLRDLNEAYWKIVQPIAWDEMEEFKAPWPIAESHSAPLVDAKVFREMGPNQRPCAHILFSLAVPYLKPLGTDLGDRVAKLASKPKPPHVVSVEAGPIKNKAELLAYLLGTHKDRLIVDCHPGRLLLDNLETSTFFYQEEEKAA
jgi:hypothetical protein